MPMTTLPLYCDQSGRYRTDSEQTSEPYSATLSAHATGNGQWMQPGLDACPLRLQKRRQSQRLAHRHRILIHRKTRSVCGQLEQRATRLAEVQRLEVVA